MGDCMVIDIPSPFPLVMNLFQPGLNRRVVPRRFLRSNDIPSIPSSPHVDFFLTTPIIAVPGNLVNPTFLEIHRKGERRGEGDISS